MTKFHLETTAGALSAALKIAKGVIERRSSIPILGAVRLAKRRVVATNLDIELSVPFAAKAMEGALVVDARCLGLLHFLDKETDITLSGTGKGALLNFPGGSYDLSTFEPADFPELQPVGTPDTISGNAATGLPRALAGVAYAISTEETRYYLNGVALSQINGEPCVVATDGHQLAWQNAHVPWPETWHDVIIPHDAVRLIVKLGACDAVSLFLAHEDARKNDPLQRYSALRVEAGGVRLTTKLINGTFPSWKRVVPASMGGDAFSQEPKGSKRLAVPVPSMRQALARLNMSSLHPHGRPSVTLVPQPDGRIALSRRELDGELAVEVLPLATSAEAIGDDQRLRAGIGCNLNYLVNLISQTGDDEITLVTETADADASMNTEGPFGFVSDDGGRMMMPMRTDTAAELGLHDRLALC